MNIKSVTTKYQINSTPYTEVMEHQKQMNLRELISQQLIKLNNDDLIYGVTEYPIFNNCIKVNRKKSQHFYKPTER